jgi:hypothetical protein
MNITKIIQTAGILAIAGAAVSFLMEGWSHFNGPDKFLIFSGFLGILYILGEVFKKSAPQLATIFQALTLALLPAIAAQVGSMVWEGVNAEQVPMSLMRPDNSLRNMSILSLIMILGIGWRTVSLLKFNRPLIDVFALLATGLLFIYPDRSSIFHAFAVLGLALLAGLMISRSQSDTLPLPYSLPVRLSGFFFFMGRACLYLVDDTLLSVFYLVISLICFIYPEKLSEDKRIKDVGAFFGLFFLFLSALSFGNALFLPGLYTYLLIQILVLLVAIFYLPAKGIGFWMASIFGWLFLFTIILDSRNTLDFGIVSLALPVLILLLGYYKKVFPAFMNGVILLLSTFVWHLYHLIKMPIMNMWMVFGIIGIVLLVSSSLVGKSESPIRVWWRNLLKEFEA